MGAADQLVFVYGTLRRGASNHWRMEGAEFVASGTVKGTVFRIDWYPGLVLGGDAHVVGEVFAVPPDQLAALDEFEGVSAAENGNCEYRRVKTIVATDDAAIEAWVWEWLGPVDESCRISSGDWLAGDC